MTQLAVRRDSFGPGDQSWLGSRRGVDTARTITIDATASSSKINNGYMKSGEPLAKSTATGKYIPYASGTSANGANVLAGFLVADLPVIAGAGDAVGALLDFGRIVLPKLPSTVAANANTSGSFVFVDHP